MPCEVHPCPCASTRSALQSSHLVALTPEQTHNQIWADRSLGAVRLVDGLSDLALVIHVVRTFRDFQGEHMREFRIFQDVSLQLFEIGGLSPRSSEESLKTYQHVTEYP